MDKVTMTETIIASKLEKGLSWESIAESVGASTVWVTSACLGMNSASKERAEAICSCLGLGSEVETALMAFPTKTWDQAVPTDPLIYRFYEVVGVYGETLKEVIQEKFGDGIMSAIDFSMDVEKEENPKGDRVVVTMNGKFLKYADW